MLVREYGQLVSEGTDDTITKGGKDDTITKGGTDDTITDRDLGLSLACREARLVRARPTLSSTNSMNTRPVMIQACIHGHSQHNHGTPMIYPQPICFASPELMSNLVRELHDYCAVCMNSHHAIARDERVCQPHLSVWVRSWVLERQVIAGLGCGCVKQTTYYACKDRLYDMCYNTLRITYSIP